MVPARIRLQQPISAGGVDLGGRSPQYSLATLNLPEGTIANGATGASVCLDRVGDTYFFGGLVSTP